MEVHILPFHYSFDQKRSVRDYHTRCIWCVIYMFENCHVISADDQQDLGHCLFYNWDGQVYHLNDFIMVICLMY